MPGPEPEVVVGPSNVDGEIARLVSDGQRDWVEIWTNEGWRRPRGSYPDVAAVLKAPPASRDLLIRVGEPDALPGDLERPYPRVIVPPVVIAGGVYRLGSDGSGCFVEQWNLDGREWKRLRRLESPSAEKVMDTPPATREQLRDADLIGLV